MKCADPVLCYTDSKGNRKFRHFSLSSYIHKISHQLVFDCGKCIFCRKKKSYELACKCVLHASLYKQNCFLTLTYDEKQDGYHNNFEYADIQKFKKRLRQHVWRTNKKRIEVFNVHEYGKNGKKHWHLIVFNHDFTDKTLYTVANGNSLYTSKALEELWPFGYNTIGDVSLGSAMYQAQYMDKDLRNGTVQNEKKSHSKHSGIGFPYFLQHYAQTLRLGYIPVDGGKLPLPRSFQKIAHKHYCHYYEQSAFHDLPWRKALYRPFKKTAPIRELADLYIEYKKIKEEKIKQLEDEWNVFISQHVKDRSEPDFAKSGSNALYDLQNKKQLERF